MIHTAAGRDRDIALLDAEIAALDLESEQRRSQLIARRNSLTQLCRVPDEILARVLWHKQVLTGTVQRGDYKRKAISRTAFGDFDHAWANVTLVCRHIRRVALDVPYLWSVLECRQDSKRLQWSQLSLERARDASLTVYVTLYTPVDEQVISTENVLNNAAARTRHLHVDVAPKILDDPSTRELLSRLMEKARPRLEWLKVSVSREYTLGAEFLNGVCHRLARVSITNLNLGHAQPPLMPALVWLHLAVREIGPHGAGLHALLLQTPLLECLDIQADGRTLPDEGLQFKEQTLAHAQKPLGPSIHLPHLRILHLTAKITWIASIINMVPIPREALYIENTSGRHLHRNVAAEEIVPWDHSSESAERAYEVVHDALLAFWGQTPENEGVLLPDGRLVTAIVDSTVYIGHPFLPKHVTPNSPTPFIHYHTRASLHKFIPLAKHIVTLNFHDSLELPDKATRALTNVRRVIIEKALDMEPLGEIATWLDTRLKQGHPLQRIEFTTSSRVFVRKYALSLAQTKMADEVTWNGEVL